jgi:hypothetical protein
MRCAKHPIVRNKIDLTDQTKFGHGEGGWEFPPTIFKRVVEKVGVSSSAVTKEIELERTPANTLPADG